ncbi:MAG: hypothetical protein GTO63_34515 [Anaerolineae bacterium]|nr:hypothetical protein [Anaerolineae bacterium]NIN99768.1 hypothetical protein [Anaerolineae bacterium]
MDGFPSSLREGDRVFFKKDNFGTSHGVVTDVFENGAFIKPTDEHGVRRLAKVQWCTDKDTFIEEVNGESLF